MKVRDLIKKLKKIDQEATVATRDHDNSDDEVSGWVKNVMEQHSSEITETPTNKTGNLAVLVC